MTKKATPVYRDLRQKLDEILHSLEAEELDIDEAIALHKKGQEIVTQMEKYLQEIGDNLKSATNPKNK